MTRIFLVGYMGCGKTTLGKTLAKELGLSFVDMDWYIEEKYCKSVRDIFVERGEEGFRLLEKKILHEVAEFENVIISTGGGTPCFFDNMDFMLSKGKTIFLNVNTKTLFNRLRVAKHSRPLLKDKTDDELMSFIEEGLNKRIPFYSKSEHTLNAELLETRKDIDATVEKVCKLLKLKNS